jgi:hypothetical protein
MPDAVLAAAYEALCADSARGIDAAAQARETSTLRCAAGGAVAAPFEEAFGSIRLFVAPLHGLTADAPAALDACVEAVSACWPEDAAFRTPRAQLHVTLFHIGRPGDARPVLDAAGADAELSRSRQLAAAAPAHVLTVERVVMSNTGVLLLLFQTTGCARADSGVCVCVGSAAE